MKENKLIEMWNRVEILGRNQQQIINELTNLRDLSIGTSKLVKNFSEYDKAIEKLTEELKESKDNVEPGLEKG